MHSMLSKDQLVWLAQHKMTVKFRPKSRERVMVTMYHGADALHVVVPYNQPHVRKGIDQLIETIKFFGAHHEENDQAHDGAAIHQAAHHRG